MGITCKTRPMFMPRRAFGCYRLERCARPHPAGALDSIFDFILPSALDSMLPGTLDYFDNEECE